MDLFKTNHKNNNLSKRFQSFKGEHRLSTEIKIKIGARIKIGAGPQQTTAQA